MSCFFHLSQMANHYYQGFQCLSALFSWSSWRVENQHGLMFLTTVFLTLWLPMFLCFAAIIPLVTNDGRVFLPIRETEKAGPSIHWPNWFACQPKFWRNWLPRFLMCSGVVFQCSLAWNQSKIFLVPSNEAIFMNILLYNSSMFIHFPNGAFTVILPDKLLRVEPPKEKVKPLCFSFTFLWFLSNVGSFRYHPVEPVWTCQMCCPNILSSLYYRIVV